MLRLRLIPPDAITPALCRQMWQLRLQNIRLRPEVDPEDDYAAFAAYFHGGATAVTFWDAAGALQGFHGWSLTQREVLGQRFSRVVAEYAFFNQGHRGGPELVLAALRLATPLLLRDRRRRKVVVGVAYPGTYVSARLMAARLVSLRGPEITPAERLLLEEFAAEHGGAGFDRAAGVVRMRTVPILQDRTSRRAPVRAALAEFEQLNPRWREGYGLPILIDLSWSAAGRAIQRGLRAALR